MIKRTRLSVTLQYIVYLVSNKKSQGFTYSFVLSGIWSLFKRPYV